MQQFEKLARPQIKTIEDLKDVFYEAFGIRQYSNIVIKFSKNNVGNIADKYYSLTIFNADESNKFILRWKSVAYNNNAIYISIIMGRLDLIEFTFPHLNSIWDKLHLIEIIVNEELKKLNETRI